MSFILNAWRATQTDQQRIGQTLIEVLKNSQVGEDCNRLIAGLQKLAYTKENSSSKIAPTIKYQSQYNIFFFNMSYRVNHCQLLLGSDMVVTNPDSEWVDLVNVVVEWLQNSPNINMDILFASWLDSDGCNLLNKFKVSISLYCY